MTFASYCMCFFFLCLNLKLLLLLFLLLLLLGIFDYHFCLFTCSFVCLFVEGEVCFITDIQIWLRLFLSTFFSILVTHEAFADFVCVYFPFKQTS